MSAFELPSCCSCHVFSYYFRLVLTLETSEMSAIFVFKTKTSQPRPQVFSVNGAFTCRRLHFWRHFLVKHKIIPNLVISNWLWWIMPVLIGEIFWMNNNGGSVVHVKYKCVCRYRRPGWKKIGLTVRVSLTCCRKITKTEHASLFKNTQ